MKTVALKFNDLYAPEDGTIVEHQELIKKNGYVWYGKKGNIINKFLIDEFNKYDENCRKIILIKTQTRECYIATCEKIENYIKPKSNEYPSYYKELADDIDCWIKIKKIKKTNFDILDKAVVCSSQKVLSKVYYHSMTPIFIIEINESEMK